MNSISLKDNDVAPRSFLYHGTTARSLPKILEQGLRPRGRRRGNYPEAISSDNRNVYLTNTYAPAFAGRARKLREGLDVSLAVVEIDVAHLDTSLLRPDEDFLAQSILPFDQAADADTRSAVHKAVRRRGDDFQEMWSASLENLGTVAYKGVVPPEAVVRVAVFKPRAVIYLMMVMSEVRITVGEHRTRGPQIEAWTRWLFDGPAAVKASNFDFALKALEGSDRSEWPSVWVKWERDLNLVLNAWDVEVRLNPNYVVGVHAGGSSNESTASRITDPVQASRMFGGVSAQRQH